MLRRKHRSYLFLFTCACLNAIVLQAQQRVILHGSVVDASGTPVSGAGVALDSLDGEMQVKALSAPNGAFLLTGVVPGSYTLTVSAVNGFAGQVRKLQVTASPAALTIVLNPETVAQTVDVGSREPLSTEAGANQDSVAVSASTLDHLPVFDQDIASALTPFLDPAATSSTGVSIVVDGIELKRRRQRHTVRHRGGSHQQRSLFRGVRQPRARTA